MGFSKKQICNQDYFTSFSLKNLILSVGLMLLILAWAPMASAQTGAGNYSAGAPVPFTTGSFSLPGAESLGSKIMIYCGNSANCSEGVTQMTAHYVGLGLTVDQLTTLPDDISPYRLVFIIMPNSAFTSSQIIKLALVVQNGGRLVLAGDYSTWYSGQSVVNTLLSMLGVTIQLNGTTGYDVGCPQTATNIIADQITSGVASLKYALTDSLAVTGSAKVLINSQGASGVPMVAVGTPANVTGIGTRPGSDVVVIGDSNALTDFCTPNNFVFLDNLYNIPAQNPCLSITMNFSMYVNGDTITATNFILKNPGAQPRAVEIKVWLGIPGIAPVGIMNLGADGSFVVPASFNNNFGPVALLTVTSAFPRGSYEFSARTLDPITAALLCESFGPFTVQ